MTPFAKALANSTQQFMSYKPPVRSAPTVAPLKKSPNPMNQQNIAMQKAMQSAFTNTKTFK